MGKYNEENKTVPSAPLHKSNIHAALQRLDDISRTAQTTLPNQYHEDHWDHFGKYLVSLLRNVPAPKNFSLGLKMISLVMEAHVPDQLPPETPTSVEGVTSESVDDYKSNNTPTHHAIYTDYPELYQSQYTKSMSDCTDVETNVTFTNL